MASELLNIICGFSLPSNAGSERIAADLIAVCVEKLGLQSERVDQIRTAVSEAVLNAIEHGNGYRSEVPVHVRGHASPTALVIQVTDSGAGGPFAPREPPDLCQKLMGRQSPRGWGLFLIREMADDMQVVETETGRTVELVFHIEPDEVTARAGTGPYQAALERHVAAIEAGQPENGDRRESMVQPQVEMEVRPHNAEVSIINIHGEVSAFAEDELMMAYGQATAGGAHVVILDFSDVAYMNSSGIGLLVTLLIRANRNGHQVLAYGLSPHYRRVFELTKLSEAIRVYEDEAAALAAAETVPAPAQKAS